MGPGKPFCTTCFNDEALWRRSRGTSPGILSDGALGVKISGKMRPVEMTNPGFHPGNYDRL